MSCQAVTVDRMPIPCKFVPSPDRNSSGWLLAVDRSFSEDGSARLECLDGYGNSCSIDLSPDVVKSRKFRILDDGNPIELLDPQDSGDQRETDEGEDSTKMVVDELAVRRTVNELAAIIGRTKQRGKRLSTMRPKLEDVMVRLGFREAGSISEEDARWFLEQHGCRVEGPSVFTPDGIDPDNVSINDWVQIAMRIQSGEQGQEKKQEQVQDLEESSPSNNEQDTNTKEETAVVEHISDEDLDIDDTESADDGYEDLDPEVDRRVKLCILNAAIVSHVRLKKGMLDTVNVGFIAKVVDASINKPLKNGSPPPFSDLSEWEIDNQAIADTLAWAGCFINDSEVVTLPEGMDPLTTTAESWLALVEEDVDSDPYGEYDEYDIGEGSTEDPGDVGVDALCSAIDSVYEVASEVVSSMDKLMGALKKNIESVLRAAENAGISGEDSVRRLRSLYDHVGG